MSYGNKEVWTTDLLDPRRWDFITLGNEGTIQRVSRATSGCATILSPLLGSLLVIISPRQAPDPNNPNNQSSWYAAMVKADDQL